MPNCLKLPCAWPLALALALPAGSLAAQEAAAPDEPLQLGARAVSLNSLLELDVQTADEEALGEVYDLVVDPTDGLLKFLVVQQSEQILGFFRRGDVRIAVPWHRVTFVDSPRQLVLDMTLEEFDLLPPWEGERTEGGSLGAAPVTERPDQAPLASD